MTETLDVMGAEMIVRRDDGMFIAKNPIPPGYFVPPHRHEHDEETFLVMEGELTLISEAGETKVGPGTCRAFKPGELHGLRNDTDGPVRMLVIASPGVQLAEMFRHFDRAARKAPLTPPDIMAIAAEYGVHFG
ncbi:MAG: cupin domain-containing protein [Reyranella sp.]|uniref:cupin domain-containing protein n=1 Tax=Reyranella sp. TaxID=1929291 RepID=UPI003D0C4D07